MASADSRSGQHTHARKTVGSAAPSNSDIARGEATHMADKHTSLNLKGTYADSRKAVRHATHAPQRSTVLPDGAPQWRSKNTHTRATMFVVDIRTHSRSKRKCHSECGFPKCKCTLFKRGTCVPEQLMAARNANSRQLRGTSGRNVNVGHSHLSNMKVFV